MLVFYLHQKIKGLRMQKIVITGLMTLASFVLHAGDTGPVSINTHSVPYLAGEGSFTWNSIKGFNVNNVPPTLRKNGWGGRLSVGIDRPYTEKISLNLEAGGGYYGSTTLNNIPAGVDSTIKITGYDLLAGATYHAQYIDIFGDFGFMAQSLLSTMTRNNAARMGSLFTGTETGESTQTEILPELKIGAGYTLRDKFSVDLSYMYVFGSSVSGTLNSTSTGGAGADAPSINSGGVTNRRNTSLSTILFGIRYHFV